jgi:hypothetical protein
LDVLRIIRIIIIVIIIIIIISCNIVFLRDIVCLRNICVNTLHKGDSDDDNNIIWIILVIIYTDLLLYKANIFTIQRLIILCLCLDTIMAP